MGGKTEGREQKQAESEMGNLPRLTFREHTTTLPLHNLS